jgi:hypothetical protein
MAKWDKNERVHDRIEGERIWHIMDTYGDQVI